MVRGTTMKTFLNEFIKLRSLTTICLSFLLTPASAWAAEEDCAMGARYYQLSSAARDDFRQQDAYEFLERAVAACPTYYYWQELAELATEFGEPARTERAAEAFVAAYEMATNEKDRARSIARYAEMLFHGSDPQRAMTYIVEARNLDPDTQWIAQLSDEITTRAANVTEEDIKRGLGDMAFKPLKLQRSVPRVETATGGGAGSRSPATATAVEDAAVAQAATIEQASEEIATTRSINIPLNFVSGSTQLDASTSNNVNVLASTLADDDFSGQNFLLVGHADNVGEKDVNLRLSQLRAVAIYEAITSLQPGLAGRIQTEGRGEEQLLSLGLSSNDHRVNRRVEVILVDQ